MKILSCCTLTQFGCTSFTCFCFNTNLQDTVSQCTRREKYFWILKWDVLAAQIHRILWNLFKKYDHVLYPYVLKLCIINEVMNRPAGMMPPLRRLVSQLRKHKIFDVVKQPACYLVLCQRTKLISTCHMKLPISKAKFAMYNMDDDSTCSCTQPLICCILSSHFLLDFDFKWAI